MRIFRKRKLSPEEQEEKARKEQEWAQKCYEAGERLGKRIDLQGKIDKINTFGNTYPKTFFTIIFGGIICCLVLNLILVNGNFFLRDTARDLKNAVVTGDNSKGALNKEIDAVFQEYIALNQSLESLLVKEPKSREDSVQICKICEKLELLQGIIDGQDNITKGSADMKQELAEIEQAINQIKGRAIISLEDSLELRSLEARKSFVEQILEE